jgi:hypothetical protein
VDVIGQDFQTFDGKAQFIRLFVKQRFQAILSSALQHLAAVCRAPDKVVLPRVEAACVLFVARRTHVLSIANNSMLVKYLLKRAAQRFLCRLKSAVPAPWRYCTSYKGVSFLWG